MSDQATIKKMRPVIILPKGMMSKKDKAKLSENDFIVVEAKDPSQVRFCEPPPMGYNEQEKAALALCRFMLTHEKGFYVNKSGVTDWYVHFLMQGNPFWKNQVTNCSK